MDPRNARVTAITTASVVVVLAVTLWFAFDTAIEEWYWRDVAGPPIQKRFGFRLEYVKTAIPGREHLYVITSVTRNGAFGKAGAQVGDTLVHWIGYAPRLDLFYRSLSDSSAAEVTFRVVNISHGGTWPKYVREITIRAPSQPSNSSLERTSARRAGRLTCMSNERAEAAQL